MTDETLAKTLEDVQFAYFGGASADSVASSLKKLALAHYTPAVDFLAKCLKDRRPDWRTQALLLLGNHFDLETNEAALDGLRGVLRHDEDAQLRRKAADFLSLFAIWPEQSLIDALDGDPHVDVRFAALQAILELTGVPRMRIRDEIGQLRAQGALPSMSDVQRITQSSSRGDSHLRR